MALQMNRPTFGAVRASRTTRGVKVMATADPSGNSAPKPQIPQGVNEPAAPAAPAAAPMAPKPMVSKVMSFGDAMAFSGPAPETINGRLAMLGFVAALGAELSSGEGVVQQLGEAALPIAGTAALFIAASMVPLLKGGDLTASLGPFSPAAEKLNGRAAMIGFAALLAIEVVRNSPLFV